MPECKHEFIWYNPITGLYSCGIPRDAARAMGIASVAGCGKTWKDAQLRREVANA